MEKQVVARVSKLERQIRDLLWKLERMERSLREQNELNYKQNQRIQELENKFRNLLTDQ
jgi:TolA-binding protein